MARSADFFAKRGALLDELHRQYARDTFAPPVVPLEMYFTGNEDEHSILTTAAAEADAAALAEGACDGSAACAAVPAALSLAGLWRRLMTIQRRPDVSAVLVGLDDDWDVDESQAAWPPARTVHIYSTASLAEAREWAESLGLSRAAEGWPYGAHPAAPPVPDGYRVLTLLWD